MGFVFLRKNSLFGKKVFDAELGCVYNALLLTEGFPSGQRDQTVNLTALPSKVRILPPPPTVYSCVLSREFYGLSGECESLRCKAGVAQW